MLEPAITSGYKSSHAVPPTSTPPSGPSGPSHPLSPGIPLARSHPAPAATNCLTYDSVSQVWLSRCNECSYSYTATPEGQEDIGNCYTTTNGLQQKSPLDVKSDSVARAIHEIFAWRDLRLESSAVSQNEPCGTSCLLGGSNSLEPTIAILRTNPDGSVLQPASGLCTALADTGSGISIINSKDFGSKGPLHDLVVFSAPLHGLGKFEVRGVNGAKSAISHLCWVQTPVMVSRSNSPAETPESAPCIVGFNAFLADITNPHAVIVGTKTIGALGAFVMPAYPADPQHSSSNQLRLQGRIPLDLALHPFLVKSAQAMMVSKGCTPDVNASLRSLLLARSPPDRA